MRYDTWERELQDDVDRDFLLAGIKDGFYIVDEGAVPVSAEVSNYSSAMQRRQLVEKQIMKEINEGRYIVSSKKPTLISAIGAIDKPDGSVRLITDCSQPKEAGALNEHATLPWTLKYQSIDDAVSAVQRHNNAFLAKLDLKSAYRSVKIHPSNYDFTGLKWQFTGHSSFTYLYDTALCFGSKLAPGIFHRLTQAVRRMMRRRGFEVIVYLDDFLIVAHNEEQCKLGLSTLMSLVRELGFAIAYEKLVPPTQCITFLGLIIDNITKCLRLPNDKVDNIRALLLSFKDKKRASLHQLQCLVGKLAFCSRVVQGGRIYLQRILDIMRPLRHKHHKVKLSADFRADIQWWLSYMGSKNFKPFARFFTKSFYIETDASNRAGAAIIRGSDWLYIDWSRDIPAVAHQHINVKETMAALLALITWAPQLRDSKVVILTDNICTKATLNKGTCQNTFLMQYLRLLCSLSSLYNFQVFCNYVPGVQNILADCVSRLSQKGHFLFWLSLLSGYKKYNMFDAIDHFQGHMSNQVLINLFKQMKQQIAWWPA